MVCLFSSGLCVFLYPVGDNRITLSLRVQDIDDNDYGSYKCVAANALGRDEETMFLYSQYINL